MIIKEIFDFNFSYIHSLFRYIEKSTYLLDASNGGHFGKDDRSFDEFHFSIPWEWTDKVDQIREFIDLLEKRDATLRESVEVQRELEENPEQFLGDPELAELDLSE